jgi:hypothetical protein
VIPPFDFTPLRQTIGVFRVWRVELVFRVFPMAKMGGLNRSMAHEHIPATSRFDL